MTASTKHPAVSRDQLCKLLRTMNEISDAGYLQRIEAALCAMNWFSHTPHDDMDDRDRHAVSLLLWDARNAINEYRDRVREELSEPLRLCAGYEPIPVKKPAPAVDYAAARERLHALTDDAELRDAFERVVRAGGELNEPFLQGCLQKKISLGHIFLGEMPTHLRQVPA